MIINSPIVLSVSQLNNQVKYILEKDFSNIVIRGEISSLNRYSSGHTYFTIKDIESEINCVAFSNVNNTKDLAIGLDMNFKGNLSLYHSKGKYQFIIKSFEKNKSGDIWANYIRLKKNLLKEGLFDVKNKKPLPKYPFKVGIISSLEGAVIHDISKIIINRSPYIKLFLKDSKVQGEDAVDDMIKGIKCFNSNNFSVDLIIIARGGGSFEDLDCFNNEKLARNIFNSKIPIITAIGHETDFTIADYVSDFRASTPSVAAEIISKKKDDLLLELCTFENILLNTLGTVLNYYKVDLEHLNNRLSYDYFLKYLNKILESKKSLDHIMTKHINDKMNYLEYSILQYKKRLNNNNLTTILKRGFGIIKDEKGHIVSSLDQISMNEKLSIELKDGLIGVKVIEKK